MKKASKRILSVILCLCMIYCMMPCSFAADESQGFTLSYSFDKASYQKGDDIEATVVLTRDTSEQYKLRGFTIDVRFPNLNLEYIERSAAQSDALDDSMRIATTVSGSTTDIRLSLFHTNESDFNDCGQTTNIIKLKFRAKEAGNVTLRTVPVPTSILIVGADNVKPAHPQGEINITTSGEPESKYKVAFARGGADGGNDPAMIADQVKDAQFTVPACGYTWEHHSFKGWRDDTENDRLWQAGDIYTMPAKNITFTAQWEQYEYKATFNGGDGVTGEPPAERWYAPGENRILPTENTLKKTGYSFEGWSYNGTVYKTSFTMPTNDIAFTAAWKKIDSGTSGGGGGGGGAAAATYPVSVTSPVNGTVSADRSSAAAGDTVTITVTPADGYKVGTVAVNDKNGKTVSTTLSNGKYTFKMPSSAVTVSVTFVKNDQAAAPAAGACPKDASCPIEPFVDTSNTAWWHDGIHYCLENGLMNGVSKNAFAPNGTTTRGMIVTILWRMEKSPATGEAMSFRDVPGSKWYTEAIRWAQSTGVVTGYNDEKFGPEDNITREQLAAILYRYASYKGIDVTARNDLSKFADAGSISSWAAENVRWANASGLINGRSRAQIAPKANATRAEAASMIQRFCENVMNWKK